MNDRKNENGTAKERAGESSQTDVLYRKAIVIKVTAVLKGVHVSQARLSHQHVDHTTAGSPYIIMWVWILPSVRLGQRSRAKQNLPPPPNPGSKCPPIIGAGGVGVGVGWGLGEAHPCQFV